jgi:integrase
MSGSVFKRCGCRDVCSGRVLGSRCPLLSLEGHGSWYVCVDLPSGSGGRQRRLRRGGFATREDAQEALDRFATPLPILSGEMGVTVRVWLNRWLASRLSLRPETRRSYGEFIRNYLEPYLGGMPVSEVCTEDVQRMFASIIHNHQEAGRPLSPASVQRIHATVRAAFNAAVRDGLIVVNPVRGVELPPFRPVRAVVWTDERVEAWRRDGSHPVVAVWTAAQTATFLRSIRDHRQYALFHLVALRGLRRGEVCGLRWEDVDLDHAELRVLRQVQRRGGKVVASEPKSTAGSRTVALDHTTVTALRQHHHRQFQDQLAAKSQWHEGGWVFTYPDGRAVAPDALTRLFAKLVKLSGLPPIRLHDLRHGAASLALSAGVELKVVSAMLGHSSIQLTADTYTSVLPDTAHRAAEDTAALVFVTGKRTRRIAGSFHTGRAA